MWIILDDVTMFWWQAQMTDLLIPHHIGDDILTTCNTSQKVPSRLIPISTEKDAPCPARGNETVMEIHILEHASIVIASYK